MMVSSDASVSPALVAAADIFNYSSFSGIVRVFTVNLNGMILVYYFAKMQVVLTDLATIKLLKNPIQFKFHSTRLFLIMTKEMIKWLSMIKFFKSFIYFDN